MIEKSCIENVKSCIEIINKIMRRIEIMVKIMIWIETTKIIAAQTEPKAPYGKWFRVWFIW